MTRRALPQGVYLTKSGRFKAQIRRGGKAVSLGRFDTPREASIVYQAALEQKREEERAGARAPRGLTLRAYGERWLEERELRERANYNAHEDKLRWNRHVVDSEFIDLTLRSIKREHIWRWVREVARRPAMNTKIVGGEKVLTPKGHTLSERSVRNCLNLLRVALGEAVDAGLIKVNPADGLRVPKQDRVHNDIDYLRVDEVEALLTLPELPEKLRVAFTVAIYTGVRAGELWGLRWESVSLDPERPEITVERTWRRKGTKGKRIRQVPLLRPAREALERWRGRDGVTRMTGPVFVAEEGRYIGRPHTKGYDGQWKKWRTRAGITRNIPLKNLRHTCGSHLIMGTWGRALTMKQVCDWLGHQSVTTTEKHYAHLAPEALQGVREQLDASCFEPARPSITRLGKE